MNLCVYFTRIRNIFIIHNSRELDRDDRVLSKNTRIGNSRTNYRNRDITARQAQ